MSSLSLSAAPAASAPVRLPSAAWLVVGTVVTALVGYRFSIAPLAWVAWAPWLLYLRGTSGWRSRLAFAGVLQVASLLQLAKIITPPIPWFFAPMFSVPAALSTAVLLIGFEAWRRRVGDAWGVALFVALTVVSDWLGWQASAMGSWGSLAYTQLDNLALLQTASLTGLAGISALLGASSAGVAWLVAAPGSRGPRAVLLAMAVLTAAAIGWGHLRLARGLGDDAVTVAAIVTDADLAAGALPPPDVLRDATDALFARSEDAAARGAQLVVWNEGATGISPEDEPAFLARAGAFAATHGVDLVAAYVVPLDGMARFENKYAWFGPEGLVETYHKHRPVPGEGAVAGTEAITVHDRPWGRGAGAICYDMDFPALLAQHAGAGIVAAPSSDWAGIDPLHGRMASVRGIEQGFAVVRPVRAATSAVYDALGRPRGVMPAREDLARTLIARVPAAPVPTVYAAVGDVLPWGGVGVLALGLIPLVRRRSDVVG